MALQNEGRPSQRACRFWLRRSTPVALAARTPAELSAYLRTRGWHLASKKGAIALWTKDVDGAELELLQPLDQELRDYALRLGDAVSILSRAEDRSELDILRHISESVWDVHTLRLFPAEQPAGMIGMDDGVIAYESLRSLVGAAAYPLFARQQRAVQPARKPQGLTDFLRTVRIGPAAEGSYILTVHTPVPPRLSDQPSLYEDLAPAEPIERQVSLAIYHAVRAALLAADASLLAADRLEPFNGAIADGVSANLCESLTGFGGQSGHPFEFAISLAATRPSSMALPPIRFHRHHLPVLREAAAELRARTPEEDVAVTGDVVRLHREGAGVGEVTLVGRVEDSETLRRVWVELSPADYETAMTAHGQTRQVTVRGNLVRRGTRFYLAGPSGFRIVTGGEVE